MQMAENIQDKSEELGKKAQDKMKNFTDKASDKFQQAQDQIVQSSEEWVGYVKDHPFQIAALTGLACFLAGRISKNTH